nr:immunoglobulin heavy chain junction region [Mus musculus]
CARISDYYYGNNYDWFFDVW